MVLPNLEGVAQKMGLLGPLEAVDIFARKFKSEAPRDFIFVAKWYLLRLTTRENLVLISQTTFDF